MHGNIDKIFDNDADWLFPTLIDNLASENQFSRSRNGRQAVESLEKTVSHAARLSISIGCNFSKQIATFLHIYKG